jgi:DNA phosphorothioation-associated putative methyltransferase
LLTKDRYLSLIKSIDFGKKLPDAIYLHEEYLKFLPLELQNFIDGLSNTLELEPYDWNLIKLFRKSFKVSFLSYPDFYKDSYPALTKSVSVDLEKLSHKVIKYDQNENPPILHRKELFIPSSSPYQKEFQEITQEGEEIGLYDAEAENVRPCRANIKLPPAIR